MPRNRELATKTEPEQLVLFDVFADTSWKDDIASMEYPFFALSAKPSNEPVQHEYNGKSITIRPPQNLGLPTIHDKDILLYCMSLLVQKMNEADKTPPRTLCVTAHDLLKSTKRPTNGDSYDRLKAALERLAGVSITTNIKTNGMRASAGFGLIDDWHIVEKSPHDERMIKLEITLSRWVYNSIMGREILTINPDYFKIRKPLNRRLYQIARKHCGTNKAKWVIDIDKLYFKIGARLEKYKFRKHLREMSSLDPLPDYSVFLKEDEGKETVVFIPKEIDPSAFKVPKKRKKRVSPTSNLQASLFAGDDTIYHLLGNAYDNAHAEIKKARVNLDINQLVAEWRAYTLTCMSKGDIPDNFQGSFMGFVRKKIKQRY